MLVFLWPTVKICTSKRIILLGTVVMEVKAEVISIDFEKMIDKYCTLLQEFLFQRTSSRLQRRYWSGFLESMLTSIISILGKLSILGRRPIWIHLLSISSSSFKNSAWSTSVSLPHYMNSSRNWLVRLESVINFLYSVTTAMWFNWYSFPRGVWLCKLVIWLCLIDPRGTVMHVGFHLLIVLSKGW